MQTDSDYACEVKLSQDENEGLMLVSGLGVDIYGIFQQELNFT